MFTRFRPTKGMGCALAAFAAFLLGVHPAPSVAQGSDPLGPFVEEALRTNLSLEGERLAERRSAAQVREAIGFWLPRVGLSSRASDTDGVPNLGDLVNPAYEALNRITGTNSFPTNLDLALIQKHDTRVQVTQPILAEGIRAGISGARALHDVQRFELLAAERRLAADVQTAYLQEASARRVVDVNEAAIDLARENERVSERLLAAGSATPEAVLRAQADRAAVEQELAEARQQHLAAARELNRILGRPLETPVEAIADTAFDQPLNVDLESALASALARREEIGEANAGVRAAGAGERAATARFLPSVSFAFDYGFQSPDFALRRSQDSWTASLVAELELPNLTNHAARKAAGYEVDRARVGVRDVEDRVRQDVQTAYEAAATAREAIATSRTRMDAARRTFDLVRRRFEEGAASSLELTDARTGYTSAELNRILTLYRYAMRRVDLERAAALRILPD